MAPPIFRFRSTSLTNTALGVAHPQPRPRRAYTRGRFRARPPSFSGTSELRTLLRPPREDERDAELVYLGGRAPGEPDRGRSSRSPRLPAQAQWLSSSAAPVPRAQVASPLHLTPGSVRQLRVAPWAFSFALWRSVEWEARDETLAAPGLGRTCPWRGHCSPGPGVRTLYSGVWWAARLGRGRRSRDRIPVLFRTLCQADYAFPRFPMASEALQRLL